MDLNSIVLSEIGETDKYDLIYKILKHKKENKVHRYTKQISGCQRQGVGVGEMDQGGQKVQASSY